MTNYLFNLDLWERYGSRFISGFVVTIELVAVTFIIGFFLSMIVAVAWTSNNKWINLPARAYMFLFRGSPLLAQLYLFYYGLGSFTTFWQSAGLWWLFSSAWNCCLVIFSLNTAAYQAEIFRGSLQSVPLGQLEACKALGLSQWTSFRRIWFPQAMILALRPFANEFILMIKASAVASLITVYDVMGVTKLVYSRTYDFQVYLWAAVLYLIIVEVVRQIVGCAERRITRHLRRI